MNIKIKIEAESGADLRSQLLNMLGITEGDIIPKPDLQVIVDKANLEKAGFSEAVKSALENSTEKAEVAATAAEVVTNEQATTRKRRTKAEIAKEQAEQEKSGEPEDNAPETDQPETVEEKSPADDFVADLTEEPAAPEATASTLTKEILTPLVVEKGRMGKRAAVIELFGEFLDEKGVAVTRLPDLQKKDYEAFHQKLIQL